MRLYAVHSIRWWPTGRPWSGPLILWTHVLTRITVSYFWLNIPVYKTCFTIPLIYWESEGLFDFPLRKCLPMSIPVFVDDTAQWPLNWLTCCRCILLVILLWSVLQKRIAKDRYASQVSFIVVATSQYSVNHSWRGRITMVCGNRSLL